MNKRDIKNIIILFSIIFVIISYNKLITPLLLIIITFVSIWLLGFRICPNKLIENKTKGYLIYEILMYISIIYFIGSFTGYDINNVNLKNIINPLIYIFSIEIIRYVIISSNKDKKYPIIIITILIIIFETIYTLNTSNMFYIITRYLMPLSIKNILLSYLTYNIGIKVPLLYRLILDLYMYIIPIIPNFAYSFQSTLNIILNVIMYFTLFNIANKRAYKEPDFRIKQYSILDFLYTIFILLIVGITSGLFRYTLISVGTDSMIKSFSKGDAVLVDTDIESKDLYNNDIIILKRNGKTFIKRIYNIDKDYLFTKDDEETKDELEMVHYSDVYGKVLIAIPYIGYPNVLIEEYRSNK